MVALAAEWLRSSGVQASFAYPEYGVEIVRRGNCRLVGNQTPAERVIEVRGTHLTLPLFGAVLLDVSVDN